MAEPLREQIMTAFAQRLGTIVQGLVDYGGGLSINYFTSPVTTRSLLWITQYDQPLNPPAMLTQLDQTPILGVMRASGSLFFRETHVADPDGAVKGFGHDMRLTATGYVKGTDLDLAGTLIERLWADHMNAILVDPRLGGLVKDCVPDGPLDTDDGQLEPLGFFTQDWLVKA
jgi:hypothetical protein